MKVAFSNISGINAAIVSRSDNYWELFWSTLVSAVVENEAPDEVVLTFGLANTSLTKDDFSIEDFTISSLSRDATNKILTLTLTENFDEDTEAEVTFGKTGESYSITNNVVGTKPILISATIENADPDIVVLIYDQVLNESSVPETTDFSITGKTISDVTVTNDTVLITVSEAWSYGDEIAISYTAGTDPIQGAIGGLAADNLTDETVINNISMDTDLATYISGLVTELSAAQLVKVNNFIKNYKAADSLTNLSDAYDVMYYLGNETAESSLRNLVKRTHDATAVNAPTFTPYEGFAGDGISMYIGTNYNPASDTIKYTLNDAAFGAYTRVLSTISSGTIFSYSPGKYLRLNTINSAAGDRVYINADYVTIALVNAAGMWITGRTSSENISYMINKSYSTNTKTSVGLPDAEVTIFKGYTGAYTDGQLSFLFIGKSLTQANMETITDIFEALMDANGKGVIT